LPAVVSTALIPREADRVAILVNPKAGPAAAQPWANRLAEYLRERGFTVEVFIDLSMAAAKANQWYEEGCLRALVGAGGDGTAAELANRTVDGVPLTLLPMGTSNLLARYFRLTKEPETLGQTLVDGVSVRLDAGRANGRIFLLMASCGFDAEVVRQVHERREGHIGYHTYVKPILDAFGSYAYPEIQIHWEEANEAPLLARWFFAFNLPCYGGGLARFDIAPDANGADGLLDVCSLREGHWWSSLKYVAAVSLKMHRRLSDWSFRRVQRVRVTSDAHVPYQLDGDPGGFLPLDLEILPGRLTLVVPKDVVG
jgi:diacylglycerol kinase family enzyme